MRPKAVAIDNSSGIGLALTRRLLDKDGGWTEYPAAHLQCFTRRISAQRGMSRNRSSRS